MREKNGFTLVELLAVIAILGILISAASISVVGILRRNKEKLQREMEKNLVSAAISYFEEEKTILRKCPSAFTPEHPTIENQNCYKMVSVQELITSGFFTDDSNYCNKDASIIVYRAQEGSYSELKAYVKEGTCDQ